MSYTIRPLAPEDATIAALTCTLRGSPARF
jgi:hypothetical protein